MQRYPDIKAISKQLGLIVKDADEDPNLPEELGIDRDTLVNNSYTFGDIIVLGFYESSKLKLASFFHEIGHKLFGYDPRSITKYEIERGCWEEGFKFAAKLGFVFDSSVDEYIDRCLETYEWTKYLGDGVDETEARRLAKKMQVRRK